MITIKTTGIITIKTTGIITTQTTGIIPITDTFQDMILTQDLMQDQTTDLQTMDLQTTDPTQVILTTLLLMEETMEGRLEILHHRIFQEEYLTLLVIQEPS